MSPQARAQLVQALCRVYSREQLDKAVRQILGAPLEQYAMGPNLPTIVDNLLTELERQTDQLISFLMNLHARTNRIDLKAAINLYFGIRNGDGDPYTALMVFDLPFVDRDTLRRKLRSMFQNHVKRVLLARGIRGVGKTYSYNLISHVAEANGITPVYIDLIEAPHVDDLIGQLINSLSLDPRDLRDRIAQISTQGKGLASALRGQSSAFVGKRSALVSGDRSFRPRRGAGRGAELVHSSYR